MRDLDKRDYTVMASALILVGVVSAGIIQDNSVQNPQTTDNWRSIELEDVNTEQTFTVSALEKPVIIETFAVWCPTCTRQQQEMKKLHNNSNITSVSLNVDPNEDKQQIVRHTEENGFKWRYAVSPPGLTKSLVDEYGTSIANPPSAPVVVVCENTSERLQNGVKPASKIQSEVERIC